jgi:hypothetical protein
VAGDSVPPPDILVAERHIDGRDLAFTPFFLLKCAVAGNGTYLAVFMRLYIALYFKSANTFTSCYSSYRWIGDSGENKYAHFSIGTIEYK